MDAIDTVVGAAAIVMGLSVMGWTLRRWLHLRREEKRQRDQIRLHRSYSRYRSRE
jgi:hypothetical protein